MRKSAEVEDLTQWKTIYELLKKSEGRKRRVKNFNISIYIERVGRQKHILDIDIHFDDTRLGRHCRQGVSRIEGMCSRGPGPY